MHRFILLLMCLWLVGGCEMKNPWAPEPPPPAAAALPAPTAAGPTTVPKVNTSDMVRPAATTVASVAAPATPAPKPPVAPAVEAMVPPATPATDDVSPTSVAVTVNGRPIYMQSLLVPLVEAQGAGTIRMLIADALVEQEAARQGLTVTAADIAAEKQRRLKPFNLDPNQQAKALELLLRQNGLTAAMWESAMRRNALLRKMAEPGVKVSDEQVQMEYNRRYGEKVQIAMIRLPSVSEAEKMLQMLKEGGEFSELARKYSTDALSARDGGVIPAFTQDDPKVPRAVRDAAFALVDPGSLSGIVQVNLDYHVLKLVKRIKPDASNFQAVKAGLAEEVRQALIEQRQMELLSSLMNNSTVQYVNPLLRKSAAEQK